MENDGKVVEVPAGAPAAAPAAAPAPKAPEVIAPDWSKKIAALEKDVEDAKGQRKGFEAKAADLEAKVAALLKGAPAAVRDKVESIWPWDWLWGE